MDDTDRVRHPSKDAGTIRGALVPSHSSRSFWHGLGDAWTALSYLIGGIVVWGGIGFGLDRLLPTAPILTVVGVLIGNAAGIYLVYLRWPIEEGPRRAS